MVSGVVKRCYGYASQQTVLSGSLKHLWYVYLGYSNEIIDLRLLF